MRVVFCVFTFCTDVSDKRTARTFGVIESVRVDAKPESVQSPPDDGGSTFVSNVATNKA
jgi:hypothetical protein